MFKIRMKNTGNFIILDEDTFYLFKDINWYEHKGYAATKLNGNYITIHRLLLILDNAQICVDHVNRNRLDNRLSNLRLCSRTENTYNATKASNNTTGYKGVALHKKNRTFVAYIGKKPREYLGSFKTAKEAAKAYNIAALKRFGKFAALNNC